MRTYEHRLLVREPHPQSLAALVLMSRYYLIQTRTLKRYRVWLSYRKNLLRRWLRERGSLDCYYCEKRGLRVNTLDVTKLATLDHYVPKSKGGLEFACSNLVVACYSCNQKKKDKMPV